MCISLEIQIKKTIYTKGKYRWPNTLRGKRLTHLLASREASDTQTVELYNSSAFVLLIHVNETLNKLSI